MFRAHPTAIIDDGAIIGENTDIWHWCHIMQGAKIGKNCSIGQGCFIASGVIIGDNVRIQNHVSIFDGVTLADHVFVGPAAVFTNVLRPSTARKTPREQYRKTLVKEYASIGANAVILCGNTIGQHALIGAGAVVTKNVPAHTTVVGNPAQPID